MRLLHYSHTALGITLFLTACGGGGGDGTRPSFNPPPPAQPTVIPPPSTSPSSEDFETAEYKSSNAAILTNAITAWAKGATGAGVKIGFIDTGLNATLDEFAGKIDPASGDVAGNRTMHDVYGHGTAVASIASAAKNNSGMQGIAFESTIIMMKADVPGSCPSACKFRDDDIADGIDAARIAGARVINISLGGDASSGVLDAVRRAAAAGIVIVVGAANDGDSTPGKYARQLASAAPGYVIIVGALGLSTGSGIDYDQLVPFSNRAGSFGAAYLAAPGFLINVTGINGGIDNLSGTSFATPVVAGAVALLVHAFPTLTARQIVEILLMTADDLGASGIDSIFGNGRLNIGRAFEPVGSTTLAGASTPVSVLENGTAPAAAGDAMTKGSFRTVILDAYARAFNINLAATLQTAGNDRPLLQAVAGKAQSSAVNIGPTTIAFSVQDSNSQMDRKLTRLMVTEREAELSRLIAASAITKLGKRRAFALGYAVGSKTLERKLRDAQPHAFMITKDITVEPGFAAKSDVAIAFREDLGPAGITFSTELGEVSEYDLRDSPATYRLASITADWQLGDSAASLGVSRLREARTVLGGRLGPAFGESGATTLFVDARATHNIWRRWSVTGSLRRGWTTFAAGSFVTGAYSLELTNLGILQPHDRVTMRLSQPLRVEKGGFDMILPIAFNYDTQLPTYGRSRFSLTPTARELSAEMGYFGALPNGTFGLNLFARANPGHMSNARADLGGIVHFDLRL